MVFKVAQAIFEAALATFVIGDLDRKSGRSDQGAAVKTTIRTGFIFRSDKLPQAIPVNLELLLYHIRTWSLSPIIIS